MRSLISTLRLALVALAVACVTGCGFQLRGAYNLPYESLYITGGDISVIPAGLKRAIRSSGSTRVVEKAEDAQATFVPTGEWRDPVILSLSSSGRVREKRLRYRYGYRVIDSKGRDLVPPAIVELNRDITYADSDVLAKTQEEDLLWRDMELDLVQQLLRRLASAKPTPPAEG
jgi:LPS-assembly lipoprotein